MTTVLLELQSGIYSWMFCVRPWMNRNRKEWSSSRVSRKVIFTENVLKTHKWIRTSWQKRWVFEMIRKSKREFTSLFQFAWGGCALAFGFRLFTYYRYWFYTTFTLKLRDLRNLPCYFRLHLKTVWYMPIDNLKATKKLWTPSSTLFKKRALYSWTIPFNMLSATGSTHYLSM